jgi:uncharacterized damage-inducible protein DinB
VNSSEHSETARIADQLDRAFTGEAWHGPALLEILAGVDAKTAFSHPIPNAHSIWELIFHISAWENAILRRMQGEGVELEGTDNFPDIQEKSERAWEEALGNLHRTHVELLKAIAAMPDSRLAAQVPGRDHNFYVTLHGAVQHAIYHAGQIALMKKLLERQ